MEKTINWTDYEERLRRVTSYIYGHLDHRLDLQTLADIAYMSPYHWHRIYHALYGETITTTVKRLRLHRASAYLVQTEMAVEEVAEKSGYSNLQSFTRIFKSVYSMPPAYYRQNGSHARFLPHQAERPEGMYDLEIKNVPEMHAVSIEHIGPYMLIGNAFDTLYGWLRSRDLKHPGMRFVGLYYDDPFAVPELDLRSRACAIVDENFPIEPPFEHIKIRGGTYAILRHKGPYASLHSAYHWLYEEWLPHSGREAVNQPVIGEYLSNPRKVAPAELMTNVYLPLK